MKKLVTGILTGLALITLVGCSSTNHADSTHDAPKKKANSLVKLNKSKVTANSKNVFTITGKTTRNTPLYILDSKGKVYDTASSNEKDGTFKITKKASSNTQKYYVTIDPKTSIEEKGNSIKKLSNISAFTVIPDNAIVASEKAASASSKSSYIESSKFAASLADDDDDELDYDETEETETNSDSSTKSSSDSRYKKVDLGEFATNPEDYEGKDIQTSGHVTYIQKNPDNEDVYYVVILPEDKYSSSGYSFGSVVEVNIDSMDETPIHEDDNITVQGGAMTSMIKLNGHTLKSDIVVDNVTVD